MRDKWEFSSTVGSTPFIDFQFYQTSIKGSSISSHWEKIKRDLFINENSLCSTCNCTICGFG